MARDHSVVTSKILGELHELLAILGDGNRQRVRLEIPKLSPIPMDTRHGKDGKGWHGPVA